MAIEKVPLEEFIISRVNERLTQILDGGGMSMLRTYVPEELAQAVSNPREELTTVEAEMGRLKAEADRLLRNLTEANREFIDERLVEIKPRRKELESRVVALEGVAAREIDSEAAVEGAMGRLTRFREVLEAGFVPRAQGVPQGVRGGHRPGPGGQAGDSAHAQHGRRISSNHWVEPPEALSQVARAPFGARWTQRAPGRDMRPPPRMIRRAVSKRATFSSRAE